MGNINKYRKLIYSNSYDNLLLCFTLLESTYSGNDYHEMLSELLMDNINDRISYSRRNLFSNLTWKGRKDLCKKFPVLTGVLVTIRGTIKYTKEGIDFLIYLVKSGKFEKRKFPKFRKTFLRNIDSSINGIDKNDFMYFIDDMYLTDLVCNEHIKKYFLDKLNVEDFIKLFSKLDMSGLAKESVNCDELHEEYVYYVNKKNISEIDLNNQNLILSYLKDVFGKSFKMYIDETRAMYCMLEKLKADKDIDIKRLDKIFINYVI